MSACNVLRCDQPGAAVVEYNPPGAPAMEALVCAGHDARIKAGDRWRWVEDDQAIVMGADLDSGGELVPISGSINDDAGGIVLTLAVRTPSGADREPIKLLLPAGSFGPTVNYLCTLFPEGE